MARVIAPKWLDRLCIVASGVLAVVGGFLVVVAAVFFALWLTDELGPGDIRVATFAWLSPILPIVVAQKLLPSKRPAFLVTKYMVVGAVLVVPGWCIWFLFFFDAS